MNYELNGTIKVIFDEVTFESGFSKREFVITTVDERFPQDVKLEFVKDKCPLLDSYAVGDAVKVGFNIRGNEYKEKYYVNLSAWRIDKDVDGQSEHVQGADGCKIPPAEADDKMPF